MFIKGIDSINSDIFKLKIYVNVLVCKLIIAPKRENIYIYGIARL